MSRVQYRQYRNPTTMELIGLELIGLAGQKNMVAQTLIQRHLELMNQLL